MHGVRLDQGQKGLLRQGQWGSQFGGNLLIAAIGCVDESYGLSNDTLAARRMMVFKVEYAANQEHKQLPAYRLRWGKLVGFRVF